MANSYKQSVNEIRKGQNLEENIPVYLNSMASLLGEYGMYNAAMMLSILKERTDYADEGLDKNNQPLYDEIMKQVQVLVADGFDPEINKSAIENMVAVREKIKARMEVVTGYIDELVIFEYMLNRLEGKFEILDFDTKSDDDLAREILQWIFQDDDNGLVNERIKTTMSLLPIRLTKAKIIDMVNTTFSLYGGSDKKAIDMFDYMLRSASGLYSPAEAERVYTNVEELITELGRADYTEITKNDYETLKDDLRLGSNAVESLSDELTDLCELSNAVLSVLLTRQYFTVEAEKSSKVFSDIIKAIVEGKEDYDSMFDGTELRIEELTERISDEESGLLVLSEKYKNKVYELMLSVPFERLMMATKLKGESTFADLVDDTSATEDDYLEKVRKNFTDDLETLLKGGSRLKNRAVIAQLLRELPVMLSSHTEVMEYIRNSLSGCTDKNEKQIAINLIRTCYD